MYRQDQTVFQKLWLHLVVLRAQFSNCFSLWAEVIYSLEESAVWLQICHTRLPFIHSDSIVVLRESKSKNNVTLFLLAEFQKSVSHIVSLWRRLISSNAKPLILPYSRLKGTDHYKAQVGGVRRATWMVQKFYRHVQKSAGLIFCISYGSLDSTEVTHHTVNTLQVWIQHKPTKMYALMSFYLLFFHQKSKMGARVKMLFLIALKNITQTFLHANSIKTEGVRKAKGPSLK